MPRETYLETPEPEAKPSISLGEYFISPLIFIASLLAVPFQLASFIPFLIFQSISILCARLLVHKSCTILTPVCTILSDDFDYTENPSNCSVVTVLSLDGSISLQKLTALFCNNVLNQKSNYKELQQYQFDFMGYRFWRDDPKFSLENHVTEEHILDPSIAELHQRYLNRTYRKWSSPWELILVQSSTNSYLVFRLHHSMGDANSVTKLLVQGLAQMKLNMPEARFPKESERPSYFLLLAPIYLFQINYKSLLTYWRNRSQTLGKYVAGNDSSYIVEVSRKLSLEKMKKTGSILECQVSSVIMAHLASCIRKFSDHLGSESVVYYTLPKSGHPKGLVNHLYIDFPAVPLIQDLEKGVKSCDEVFRKMKTGWNKLYVELLFQIVGTWVKPLRSGMAGVSGINMGMSNVAGERGTVYLDGKRCSSVSMSCGPGPTTNAIGVNFTVYGYGQHVQIAVTAKENFLSRKEIHKLICYINSEFTS